MLPFGQRLFPPGHVTDAEPTPAEPTPAGHTTRSTVTSCSNALVLIMVGAEDVEYIYFVFGHHQHATMFNKCSCIICIVIAHIIPDQHDEG